VLTVRKSKAASGAFICYSRFRHPGTDGIGSIGEPQARGNIRLNAFASPVFVGCGTPAGLNQCVAGAAVSSRAPLRACFPSDDYLRPDIAADGITKHKFDVAAWLPGTLNRLGEAGRALRPSRADKRTRGMMWRCIGQEGNRGLIDALPGIFHAAPVKLCELSGRCGTHSPGPDVF
jgi:hypothetical protein